MIIPDYNVLDELDPCPFCGGRPNVCENDSYGACSIWCNQCECGIGDEVDKLPEVVQMWQTRKGQKNPFNFLKQFEHWFAFEVAIRNNDL